MTPSNITLTSLIFLTLSKPSYVRKKGDVTKSLPQNPSIPVISPETRGVTAKPPCYQLSWQKTPNNCSFLSQRVYKTFSWMQLQLIITLIHLGTPIYSVALWGVWAKIWFDLWYRNARTQDQRLPHEAINPYWSTAVNKAFGKKSCGHLVLWFLHDTHQGASIMNVLYPLRRSSHVAEGNSDELVVMRMICAYEDIWRE